MARKLIPFGYAAKDAEQRLEGLMTNPQVVLVDIRYNARSRIPQWNKGFLQKKWVNRYWPLSVLGNENYNNGGPIKISNPELGIPLLIEALQKGCILILLCACKEYETCHRKVVVEMVRQVLPEVEAQS